MANINIKTLGKNNQKKAVSISSAKIKPSALTVANGVATAGTLASGDVVKLFSLPANSVVTNAFIVVTKGATGGTQTLKITVGSTDSVAAVAVGTADGVIKGGAVTKVATGTGADVTVTTGVADLTDGEFEVVVEYIEYTRTIGEYTK